MGRVNLDEYHILYASDDRYAPIAGVSMTSLFENNQDARQIHIWYLVDHISKDNLSRLQETADKYHRAITFVNVDSSLEKVKGLGAGGWFEGSFSAYSRLFLQEYIGDKGIGRLLYLDCDTIVNQSIAGLWGYNLEGKALGMVCDYIGAGIRDAIGLEATDKYYNSGVLLIDVDLWKTHECQRKILWHMENIRASYPFVDQDIINVVLKDDIKTLPWNWNVFPYYFTYTFKNIQKQYDLNAINQYSTEEYREGLTEDGKPDAVVLHYTATFYGKPWYCNSIDPTKEIWKKYYEISNWKDNFELITLRWNRLERFERVIVSILPQRLYLLIFRHFSRRYMNSLRDL